jgi:SAM-dependent methyltransferase
VKERYGDDEFRQLVAAVKQRRGWNFSSMSDWRAPTPWEYDDVVRSILKPSDHVLDVGTGGGERLLALAPYMADGVGIDPDSQMVAAAVAGARDQENVRFAVGDARLRDLADSFDVILNRHAAFDLSAVAAHLQPGGAFITQQVGERNMRAVHAALGEPFAAATITRTEFDAVSGLSVDRFEEYDVEYVVHDIESLLFWFHALDRGHADMDGRSVVPSVDALNKVLDGNVDHRGFVTNEHRYLVVAQKT